jgi:hypothetical protein
MTSEDAKFQKVSTAVKWKVEIIVNSAEGSCAKKCTLGIGKKGVEVFGVTYDQCVLFR